MSNLDNKIINWNDKDDIKKNVNAIGQILDDIDFIDEIDKLFEVDIIRELMDEEEFVFSLFWNTNIFIFKYVSERLRDSKDFIIKLLKSDVADVACCFEYVSERLQDDSEIAFLAISQVPSMLKYASPRIKDDKDFLLSLPKTVSVSLDHISENLQKDKQIILRHISSQRKNLTFRPIPPEYEDDKDVALAAVKSNIRYINTISPKFRIDKDILLAAIASGEADHRGIRGLNVVPNDMLYDKDIVLAAIKRCRSPYELPDKIKFKNLPEVLQNDKDLVVAMARLGYITPIGDLCENIPLQYNYDFDVWFECIKIDSMNAREIPCELQKNRDFLTMISKDFKVFRNVEIWCEHLIPELEELRKEEMLKKSENDNYALELFNKLYETMQWLEIQQSKCVENFLLSAHIPPKQTDEDMAIKKKVKELPCYKDIFSFSTVQTVKNVKNRIHKSGFPQSVIAVSEYKYEAEVVSIEARKLILYINQFKSSYLSPWPTEQYKYIENGYDVIKKLLDNFLAARDTMSIYDRAICETLALDAIKQMQMLQANILLKNDPQLNNDINTISSLFEDDLNILKSNIESQFFGENNKIKF